MELILWFAGVCIMWTCIKFVFMVFKRLGSKNTMNDVIDKMEAGMAKGADNVAKKMKEKRKKQEEQPIVTIR